MAVGIGTNHVTGFFHLLGHDFIFSITGSFIHQIFTMYLPICPTLKKQDETLWSLILTMSV